MKKMVLSAFAAVAFGSIAFAGEKGAAQATCNCQPAAKVVTLKPVEVKVVKVETVKAYVAEECGTCARRTTRLRDRLAARRAPVVVVAEAPCCEKAAATKK